MLLSSMSTSCLMGVVLVSSLVSNQPMQFNMLQLLKEHIVGLIHYVPGCVKRGLTVCGFMF